MDAYILSPRPEKVFDGAEIRTTGYLRKKAYGT